MMTDSYVSLNDQEHRLVQEIYDEWGRNVEGLEHHLRIYEKLIESLEEGYGLTLSEFVDSIGYRSSLDAVMEEVPVEIAGKIFPVISLLDKRLFEATQQPLADTWWSEELYDSAPWSNRIPKKRKCEYLERDLKVLGYI